MTLVNQNILLTQYLGRLRRQDRLDHAAGATFIGWARRPASTLVVTILHGTPLTELTVGARLLNWGFVMDHKVRPVGVLVPPRPAARRDRSPRSRR